MATFRGSYSSVAALTADAREDIDGGFLVESSTVKELVLSLEEFLPMVEELLEAVDKLPRFPV